MNVKINIVGDDHGGYTTEVNAEGKNVEILEALANAVVHVCSEMEGGFDENAPIFSLIFVTMTNSLEVVVDETDD